MTNSFLRLLRGTLSLLGPTEAEGSARLSVEQAPADEARSAGSAEPAPEVLLAEVKALRTEKDVQEQRAVAWRRLLIEELRRNAHPRAVLADPGTLPVVPPAKRIRAGRMAHPAPAPLVSFVVLTLNKQSRLKAALAGIREQDLPDSAETIVLDCGSTDGSRQWLGKQPDLMTILAQPSNSPADAPRLLNLALGAARGKWICLLSDDGILAPQAVAQALQHLESMERQGAAVGAGAFYVRELPADERYHVAHTVSGMLQLNQGLLLRDALEDVGFADSGFASLEETLEDLSLKLWNAGYSVLPCPEAFVDRLLFPLEIARPGPEETPSVAIAERWDGSFTSSALPEIFARAHREYVDGPDAEAARNTLRRLMEEEGRQLKS